MKARGAKRVIPLAVSAPFHCPLLKPAEDRLAPELRALPAQDPRIPVIANVDAEPKREAVVRRLIADGARTFVELGPCTVLAGLVKKIDRAMSVVSIEDVDGLTAALPLLKK